MVPVGRRERKCLAYSIRGDDTSGVPTSRTTAGGCESPLRIRNEPNGCCAATSASLELRADTAGAEQPLLPVLWQASEEQLVEPSAAPDLKLSTIDHRGSTSARRSEISLASSDRSPVPSQRLRHRDCGPFIRKRPDAYVNPRTSTSAKGLVMVVARPAPAGGSA